jgi:hypothetical protein
LRPKTTPADSNVERVFLRLQHRPQLRGHEPTYRLPARHPTPGWLKPSFTARSNAWRFFYSREYPEGLAPMTLTAKQEAFAQAIASGLNQSDAYRSAYSAGKMKAETVQNSAYKLLLNGEVTARVKELQAELANKSLWTREQSVAVLSGVVGDVEARHGDKISAVKVLNDMQGFNAPTKLELQAKVSISVNFD